MFTRTGKHSLEVPFMFLVTDTDVWQRVDHRRLQTEKGGRDRLDPP